MAADKEPRHYPYSQLQQPDGSVFVYCQAAIDMKKGEYVLPNANGRLANVEEKFGGMPMGRLVEDVGRDEWTFVLIKNPDPRRQPEQKKVQLSPDQVKQLKVVE